MVNILKRHRMIHLLTVNVATEQSIFHMKFSMIVMSFNMLAFTILGMGTS